MNKLSNLSLLLAAAACLSSSPLPVWAEEKVARTGEYPDFNPGNSTVGSEWVQAIVIKSPELRSDIQGTVKVDFQAPGMTIAKAYCWQQPTAQDRSPWGHDVNLAPDLKLDAEGNGSFEFPADQFPNGPIAIRIVAQNDAKQRDLRELQLFNKGGVVWNQGIPKTDPPAAEGMKLAFADDFNGPLSISKNGKGAKYTAHKPGGGDFSGYPFTDPESPANPFSQVGTYLRIRASKQPGTKGSTGLIASVDSSFEGFTATAPCYFECRLIAQSAPGTWPAFWTLTKGQPTDELDILEAYGGWGKGKPNYPGYSTTTHFWGQKGPDGKQLKMSVPTSRSNKILELGGKSTWSTTFHTYAVKVTKAETIYYFDDIEVLRHPSGGVSAANPHFFLINYAIGGISGWKIDLEREGNASDMYVDYVRVYQGSGE
jgi:hypothetical protein